MHFHMVGRHKSPRRTGRCGGQYSSGTGTTYDDLKDAEIEHNLRFFLPTHWIAAQVRLLTILTAKTSPIDRAGST